MPNSHDMPRNAPTSNVAQGTTPAYVSELTPSPENPRKISAEKLALLKQSMDEFGDLSGIMYNIRTGHLVGGHQRIKHLRSDGPIIKKPAPDATGTVSIGIVQTPSGQWAYRGVDWPVSKEQAANIVANQHGGEFDEGELHKRIGDREMKDAPTRTAEASMLQKKWNIERGDIYKINDSLLMCGSSTDAHDVQRLISAGDGKRAILFATDPPYLVNYTGAKRPGGWRDWMDTYRLSWNEGDGACQIYDDFVRVAIAEAITTNSAWYCWHADSRRTRLEEIWHNHGAFVRQVIIWVKLRPVITYSWYLWRHEPCLFGWRQEHKPPLAHKMADSTVWCDEQSEILLSDFQEYTTVWSLKDLAGKEKPNHPITKPLECFTIPMRQHMIEGDILLGAILLQWHTTHRRAQSQPTMPRYGNQRGVLCSYFIACRRRVWRADN